MLCALYSMPRRAACAFDNASGQPPPIRLGRIALRLANSLLKEPWSARRRHAQFSVPSHRSYVVLFCSFVALWWFGSKGWRRGQAEGAHVHGVQRLRSFHGRCGRGVQDVGQGNGCETVERTGTIVDHVSMTRRLAEWRMSEAISP